MPKDLDDNYYYDAGTINEQLEEFQIVEQTNNGEFIVEHPSSGNRFRMKNDGTFKPKSLETEELNHGTQFPGTTQGIKDDIVELSPSQRVIPGEGGWWRDHHASLIVSRLEKV